MIPDNILIGAHAHIPAGTTTVPPPFSDKLLIALLIITPLSCPVLTSSFPLTAPSSSIDTLTSLNFGITTL